MFVQQLKCKGESMKRVPAVTEYTTMKAKTTDRYIGLISYSSVLVAIFLEVECHTKTHTEADNI